MADRPLTWPEIRRGGTPVLKGQTVHLEPGTNVGLAGLNGAGKTSLLLYLADALLRRRPPIEGGVAFLPQDVPAPSRLRVRDFSRLVYGVEFERIVDLYGELGLQHFGPRRITRVSKGERQLLAALMTLAQRRGLILLDEPTASLDMRRRAQLQGIIAERRGVEEHAVLIVASPVPSVLARTCQHLAVLTDRTVIVHPNFLASGSMGSEDELEAAVLRMISREPEPV